MRSHSDNRPVQPRTALASIAEKPNGDTDINEAHSHAICGTRELEALIRVVVRDEMSRHEATPRPERRSAAPTADDDPMLHATDPNEPHDDEPDAQVMCANDVAAFLGVDRNTVYEYAGRGTIPCRRLGKRLLFHKPALVAWLDPCKAASTRKG
jgi:excisionase family DNA binding protein